MYQQSTKPWHSTKFELLLVGDLHRQSFYWFRASAVYLVCVCYRDPICSRPFDTSLGFLTHTDRHIVSHRHSQSQQAYIKLCPRKTERRVIRGKCLLCLQLLPYQRVDWRFFWPVILPYETFCPSELLAWMYRKPHSAIHLGRLYHHEMYDPVPFGPS